MKYQDLGAAVKLRDELEQIERDINAVRLAGACVRIGARELQMDIDTAVVEALRDQADSVRRKLDRMGVANLPIGGAAAIVIPPAKA